MAYTSSNLAGSPSHVAPPADPNVEELVTLSKERGFSEAEINERLRFFGGFEGLS